MLTFNSIDGSVLSIAKTRFLSQYLIFHKSCCFSVETDSNKKSEAESTGSVIENSEFPTEDALKT